MKKWQLAHFCAEMKLWLRRTKIITEGRLAEINF